MERANPQHYFTLAASLGIVSLKGIIPDPIIPLYIDLQEFRRIGRIEDFLRELLARSYSLKSAPRALIGC